MRLHSQVDDRTLDAEIETEYRRALFRRAALDVQEEVQPESWACFWRTAVERQPIVSVAKSLNKSVGSVYAARSRIMRRIRTRIERVEVGEVSDG